MSKFYGLKDFVHDMGLNMNEFKRLDPETQRIWRERHQEKLKEKIKERDRLYEKHLFEIEFLEVVKSINAEEYQRLTSFDKDLLNKEYKIWKKKNICK